LKTGFGHEQKPKHLINTPTQPFCPEELKSGSVMNKKANLINFRPPFPPSIPPGAPHPQKNPQKKKEKQNRGWAVSTGVKKVSKAAPSTPSKYFVSISPQVVGFDT
jgi:hypothetical protein